MLIGSEPPKKYRRTFAIWRVVIFQKGILVVLILMGPYAMNILELGILLKVLEWGTNFDLEMW